MMPMRSTFRLKPLVGRVYSAGNLECIHPAGFQPLFCVAIGDRQIFTRHRQIVEKGVFQVNRGKNVDMDIFSEYLDIMKKLSCNQDR
jgi:hypothetical protein